MSSIMRKGWFFFFTSLLFFGCDSIIPHHTIWYHPAIQAAGYSGSDGDLFDIQLSSTGCRSGYMFITWLHFNGLRISTLTQRYDVSSGWDSYPIPIDTDIDPGSSFDNNTANSSDPDIAVDASGNAIAVWRRYEDNAYHVWSSRFSGMDQMWTASECINPTAGAPSAGNAYGLSLKIAMAEQGNSMAVWIQRSLGGESTIWYNYYDKDSSWGAAAQITATPGIISFPEVAMDRTGNTMCIWRRYEDFNNFIYASYFTPGSGWTAPLAVSGNDQSVDAYAQVSFDGSGCAHVIWTQRVDSETHLWARKYHPEEGWETSVCIDSVSGVGSVPFIDVAADGHGNVIVMWNPRSNLEYGLRAVHYNAGSDWSPAVILEDGASLVSDFDLSMNGKGDALVVWCQSKVDGSVFSNYYTAGSGWTDRQYVSSNIFGSMRYPNVNLDEKGKASAVWSQHGYSYYVLWTNTFH